MLNLKTKTLILILSGVMVVGGLGYGGYRLWNSKESIKQSENINNQNDDVTDELITLGNGWTLYLNHEYKYSIELPSDWLIIRPSNPYNYIITQNLDPNNYPLIGEGELSRRNLPVNYRYLSAGPINGRLKIENGHKVIDQTQEENEALYNDLQGHSTIGGVLLPETNIYIGGKVVKGIFSTYRNQKYNYYYIPNNDFSVLYVIITTKDNLSDTPEYRHVMESFKIL